MKCKRKSIAVLTLVLVIGVSASNAQLVLKPLIEPGMGRSELKKALPIYAKAFAMTEPKVFIPGFHFHGMKGDANFVFLQGDKLLLFTWEHKASGASLDNSELRDYSNVLKGLELDYGRPPRREASELDPRIELCYWRLPHASGHTSFDLKGILKFQIADNTWLETMKPH